MICRILTPRTLALVCLFSRDALFIVINFFLRSVGYAWRSADGSNNNVNMPDMGKAGTPYARSVQQTHPLPKHELPDAGLVFDTLRISLQNEKLRRLKKIVVDS